MVRYVELVNNFLTLRGMLHVPEGAQGAPIAVLLHGFTGNKMEPHFQFVKLSRLLEQRGIAALRFDFAGSGESDGTFSDMTFSSEVCDANAILDYAASLDFVDKSRIYLLGLSMGGAVAGATAAMRADVKKLCLWAPAGDLPKLLRAAAQELDTGGDTVDFGGNAVGRGLLNDLENKDLFALAAGFPGDVLLIHGDRDEAVPLENAYRYQGIYGEKARLRVVPGAGHTFDSAAWEADVLRETLRFFAG